VPDYGILEVFCIPKRKLIMVKVNRTFTPQNQSVATAGILRRITPNDVLAKLKAAALEEKAAKLGKSLGLPYVDLHLFAVNPEHVVLIPVMRAKELRIVLYFKEALKVRIAGTNPGDPAVTAYLQELSDTKGYEIDLGACSEDSLVKAWEAYDKRPLVESLDLMRVALSGQDLEDFDANFGALLSLKDSQSLSTSKILETILAGANKLRGSDIHLEPEEGVCRLRYRIDGVLQEIGMLPAHIYTLILNRVKMIANMKLNIRDKAQDGHFYFTREDQEKRIDLRVSVIPGKYGESITMRLLNRDDVMVPVDSLGLRGNAYDIVMQAVRKPNGMILNTGPTGSGKTTTLYSLLNKINDPNKKIITVEDPIEYDMPGIVQTEVSEERDYTFGNALRAIVRQDPDVVLVGEIRDEDTANTAINAALTGHLVFSTLHTNSAVGSIARLIELGVKASIMGSAVNLFVAQRLVRRLCQECRAPYAPASQTTTALRTLLQDISPEAHIDVPKTIDVLYRAVGCPKCNMSGYHGRIAIFEILEISDVVSDMIANYASEKDVMTEAKKHGMVTMSQDGLLKVIEGITTFEEVANAVGREEGFDALYENIAEGTSTEPDADGTL
jgi:type IV pilus assembly protein PilB